MELNTIIDTLLDAIPTCSRSLRKINRYFEIQFKHDKTHTAAAKEIRNIQFDVFKLPESFIGAEFEEEGQARVIDSCTVMRPWDVGVASKDRSFICLDEAECGTLVVDSGGAARVADEETFRLAVINSVVGHSEL